MYMLPELRRIVLLLYAIRAGGDGESIIVRSSTQITGDGRLVEVSERENYILIATDPLRIGQVKRYPLDAVRHIYKFKDDPVAWRILIDPSITT